MNKTLDDVTGVDIDVGRFKYILIKVYTKNQSEENFKYIVRGYKWAGFHGDIYDHICPGIEGKNLECECIGGGRIFHDNEAKKILIYGYSQGFGRADHEITTKVVKEHFKDYPDITWSNEGY